MRRLLLFMSLLSLSIIGMSQNYGDKSYYLIDTFNLDKVTIEEKEILDSLLTIYHNSPQDTSSISGLYYITFFCSDIDIREQYNDYLLRLINSRKDNTNYSRLENLYYYKLSGNCYVNKGFFAHHRGDIKNEIFYYQEVIKIAEHPLIDNSSLLCKAYINLCTIYYNLEDLPKAFEYNILAKDIAEKLAHDENKFQGYLSYIYNNMSVLYSEEKNYDEALNYTKKGYELSKSDDNSFAKGLACSRLGSAYNDIDSIATAISYLRKAEVIFHKIENKTWISLNYCSLGNIFLQQDKLTDAKHYVEMAYDYAKRSDNITAKTKASDLLHKIYLASGDYENALIHYKIHEHLTDSITGVELNLDILQKELIFKNEKENALEKKENEQKWEIAKVEKKQQRSIKYGILLLLFLVLVFSIILYIRLKVTTKQKVVIEKQNNERKILLQEIHHRVKNNFQIVSSVLKLQAADEENQLLDLAFSDAINRIQSMAAVHEMIYKQEDFAAISPKEYFVKLTDSMHAYTLAQSIIFDIDSEVNELNIRTLIPLGISINELVTNSMKYAFDELSDTPTIKIRLAKTIEGYILLYQDNGVGIGNSGKSDSFGMELISTIIDQIEGKLEQIENSNWSTHLQILFSQASH